MRFLFAAALALAIVGPAAAQGPVPGRPSGTTSPSQPASGPALRQPAARPVAGMPAVVPARTAEARSTADVEAAMKRAQKTADDRAKAWDAKMRRTMGSICSGC